MLGEVQLKIKENEDILLLFGTAIGIGVLSGVCGYTLGYTDGFQKGMVAICDTIASLAKAAP